MPDHNSARRMRQLAHRFGLLRDWFLLAGGLKNFTVEPLSPITLGFRATATWVDAETGQKSLSVVYGPEVLRARIPCTKELGRRLLEEILRARGVLD